MKKMTMVVVVGLFVVFVFSNAHALRFCGGPKYADPQLQGENPLKYMPGITQLIYLSDPIDTQEHKLHFKITFDKEVKHVDAFWAKKGDDDSENRAEVVVKYQGTKDGEYEYLVVLDVGNIIKIDPLYLFIGCYSPAMGYPNLREIYISFDDKKHPQVSIGE